MLLCKRPSRSIGSTHSGDPKAQARYCGDVLKERAAAGLPQSEHSSDRPHLPIPGGVLSINFSCKGYCTQPIHKRVVKKQNKTYQTNAELHRFFTVSKISDAELITCQQNSHMMSKTELVQQQTKK